MHKDCISVELVLNFSSVYIAQNIIKQHSFNMSIFSYKNHFFKDFLMLGQK